MKSVLVPNAPWPTVQVSLPVQQKKCLYGWRKAEILQENAKLEDFLCSEPRVNLSKMHAAKRYRDPVTGRFSNKED